MQKKIAIGFILLSFVIGFLASWSFDYAKNKRQYSITNDSDIYSVLNALQKKGVDLPRECRIDFIQKNDRWHLLIMPLPLSPDAYLCAWPTTDGDLDFLIYSP